MIPPLQRALLFLALAAIALVPVDRSLAQTTDTQASLEALAGPVYRELAALKGVSAPGPPPPIQIKSRAEMRRFVEQELDRKYSGARVEAERKGMVAWGLIPPDYDLRRLFVDLMEEQIAAYYDPRAKVMVVGDWLPPAQQQAALMHELVHALQDRVVSLETFITPKAGEGDQLLARQALIEGEAVALSVDLLLRAQGLQLSALPDLTPVRSAVIAGTTGPVIGSAPKFIRDLLIFPYVDGLSFVYELRKREPWSAVSPLYRDPPRSTAQILHPEKRLAAREDPIRVALPDLGGVAPGLSVVTEDELGEFALGSVMGLQLGEQPGRAAAATWRGDRYRVWEDSDGTLALAYLVAVTSDRAASALAAEYARVIEKRYPELSGKGVSSGPLTTWRSGARVFAVEPRGAEVLVLERVPEASNDRMRDAIWRSRATASRP